MSPHEVLLSASGLRPMSAFVVVGAVVLSVWVSVVRLAAGDALQPERLRTETSPPPAFSIVARDGETLARFVPRFDLELSPRSLWQAHTPRLMAAEISKVLGGEPGPRELLAAMLPDADAAGEVRVEAWKLTLRQSQRISDWISGGAGTGLGRLEGFRIERDADRTFRLVWRPEVALSAEERERHGVVRAWRWARRIADGLHACLHDASLDPTLVSDAEASRARDTIWKALLPTAFARPVRGLAPERVVPLRTLLEAQGVASWQMRIAYARDRVYPAGEHELVGSWGFPDAQAREAAPRDGLELLSSRILTQRRFAVLERQPEVYRWIADRPVRGERASSYVDFQAASRPPLVRSTLDLGLQRFLGRELQDTLQTHQAAVAMGIVVDVASGEILALDSAEAYPIQPFAPVYHTFTPGSTFKVVTMASALEAGVVRPGDELEVGQGEFRVIYPDGRPSGRVIREAEGALTGRDTIERFFAFSVNAALAQIGMRVPDVRFRQDLVRLGYGTPPGSGLGPERAGSLPATPWSYAYTHASLGFGHNLSTTLWRHAEALATIVRGGVHRPLSLVRSVEQGERRIELAAADGERVYSEATCAEVRDMMRLGAAIGTGEAVRGAFLESLRAGLGREPEEGSFDLGTKTGTAQKVPSELCVHVELGERARWEREGLEPSGALLDGLSAIEKPHARCYTSSICAFGRVSDPLLGRAAASAGSGTRTDTLERDIMVLIVVDEPRGKERFGGRVAGPAAQRVLAEALGLTTNGRAPSFEIAPGFGVMELAMGSGAERTGGATR